MRETLYSNTEKTSELIKAIAVLVKTDTVKQVITYNYDDILEHEIGDEDNFNSIFQNDYCGLRKKPIYHVHGLIPQEENAPGNPILSETEYHKLYSRMHHWANVVQLNALYSTTCFFIGFSMTDPNQRRLLDLARNREDDGDLLKPRHFVFLKRQVLKGEAVKAVNDEHCGEIEKMMADLGLNVIWFDDFSDLPNLLRSLIPM